METFSVFGIGFLITFFATAAAVKVFPKIGLLDFPHRYHLPRPRIPYPGGLIFLFASLGILVINDQFMPIFPPLFLLGIVSFLDDEKPLSVYLRIFVHLLAAAWIFWLGIKINFIGNPFQNTNFEITQYPMISFVLTVGWIIAVQNAMNWFDGIRGLTVGISGVGFLTLGILGLIRPELFFDPTHMPLTLVNLFLAGCALGGFWWFWKGKIILGDTGSQTLGFLLAVMAIFSGAKIATTLLVLGLPVLDAIFVVFRRILVDKKSPFQGDLAHLHHNLTRLIGENQTALFLIFLSGVFGTIALFLSGMMKLIALIFISILILFFCFWSYKKAINN